MLLKENKSPARWTALVAVTLVVVAATRPAAGDDRFDAAIERAVKRGGAWLLSALPQDELRPQGYPMGVEALGLYALLHAGRGPDEALIKQRFALLRNLQPQKTYGVSLGILAIDARRRARAGAGVTPGPIGGADRVRMQELVDWLLANYAGGSGAWSYNNEHKGEPDFSNTQFAVLALGVALRNGLAVRASVFNEVGANLVKRQVHEVSTTVPLKVTYRTVGEPGKTPAPVAPGRGCAGGWRYWSDDSQFGPSKSLSMTAAGISSLLVVCKRLRRMNRGIPGDYRKAIRDGLIWLTKYHRNLRSMRGRSRGIYKDYFYAIYSLEKVGDLGDILRLGSYEWYREEAAYLLRTQKASGSWGSGGDRLVHTALALLFLTRATSVDDTAAPRRGGVAPPPPYIVAEAQIVRSGGKVGEQEHLRDHVYSDHLSSFVSARMFFAHLRTVRESDELRVAKDLLRNWEPTFKPELVPHLASLLDGSSDAVARFARKSLFDLTGLRKDDAGVFKRWHERWKALRQIGERRERKSVGRVLEVLENNEDSLPLRETALWAVTRLRYPGSTGDLIRLLDRAPRALREPLHEALCKLSGEKRPFDSRRWKETAVAWRAWWEQKPAIVAPDPGLTSILEALETADRPEAAAASLKALAAAEIGVVVPAILERMDAADYSVYLIEALERITGQRLGPARGPWAAWWGRRNPGGG